MYFVRRLAIADGIEKRLIFIQSLTLLKEKKRVIVISFHKRNAY